MSLVYVHIGDKLPEYIYDSIYQTLLFNHLETKIYVILDDPLISQFESTINTFNLNTIFKDTFNLNSLVKAIPTSGLIKELEENNNFCSYQQLIRNKFSNLAQFRNGFWLSTTARFFYIEAFMKVFNVQNIFHIENDVMLYENLHKLFTESFSTLDKMCMIKDAPDRVIPSFMYIPSHTSLQNLNKSIVSQLENSPEFLNDMILLGKFTNCFYLPIFPMQSQKKVIFDGAAIGQYLGGIDYQNLNELSATTIYANPSRGFINETSVFKANTCEYLRSPIITQYTNIPIRIYRCSYNKQLFNIINLHIHSKQLYQFSSVFSINFENIISGDRICSICDFVLLTRDILNYHQNLNKFAKDIIIINDISNVNIIRLNAYFKTFSITNKTKHIKLFIYTHMLTPFQIYIAKHLDKSLQYSLYIHNSDHSFNDTHDELLQYPHIKRIFSQNIDYSQEHPKLKLLPIGIANSMWPHGDIVKLYTIMRQTYFKQKTKNIYININPNTYGYRGKLLNLLRSKHFEMSTSKPYDQYLLELSQHYFCLCVRGNGLDTHRFWEALYLGTIPVIINNSETRMNNFVRYLRDLEVPFVEITSDQAFHKEYFNEILYKKILKEHGSSIFNIDGLKLDSSSLVC